MHEEGDIVVRDLVIVVLDGPQVWHGLRGARACLLALLANEHMPAHIYFEVWWQRHGRHPGVGAGGQEEEQLPLGVPRLPVGPRGGSFGSVRLQAGDDRQAEDKQRMADAMQRVDFLPGYEVSLDASA